VGKLAVGEEGSSGGATSGGGSWVLSGFPHKASQFSEATQPTYS
jgi:hypothetical protein